MVNPTPPASPEGSFSGQIQPGSSKDNEAPPLWGTGQAPPVTRQSLPEDDPWVKAMVQMFKTPLPEARLFAGRFRHNMFQWLNNQIKADMKRQKAAAQKFKESINE